MKTDDLSRFVQTIREAALPPHHAALSDGQLLERYLHGREAEAFAVLVQRHGPMIWGVCRRLLHSHQDAEDAFQATFLVLIRKAASVRSRDLVANWLYGVAHQTALKARATTAKRRAREKQVAALPEPAVAQHEPCDELQSLLDQELARLPDKYRTVIVLCDLEGKTRREAAGQLKLPEGTVASRLATARTMLARRLARRGLPLSGAALATVWAPSAVAASVPISVAMSTFQAATLLAAGGVTAAKAGALAQAVLKTMLTAKLKKAAAVLVVLAVLGVCTAALTQQMLADKPAAQPVPDGQQLAALPPAKLDPPQPLPEEIVTAWEKVGARVGWLRLSPAGAAEFIAEDEGKPGDLPAFEILASSLEFLAKLPVPTQAFALFFHKSQTSLVTNPGLKGVGELKTLQVLCLANCREVGDTGLKELAGLRHLQLLDLGYTKVTDAGLKELAGLKEIKTLDFSMTAVTDAGLKELVPLKRLKTLNLQRSRKVTDVGMKELAGLKGLQTLSLHDTAVTGAGLRELAGLKELKTLHLGNTRVAGADLKELAGLKGLQTLYIHVGDSELRGLGECGLLHLLSQAQAAGGKRPSNDSDVATLDLSGTAVTNAGLKGLAELKGLETLNLSGTSVTCAGLKELAGLKQLRTLSLRGMVEALGAGLKDLAGLRSLQTLDLYHLNLFSADASNTMMKELAGLKGLKSLNLTNTLVTDAGLKALASLKELQTLYLNNMQVTAATLRTLREIGQLHALDRAQAEGGKRPATNADVLTLNLAETFATDAGLKELADLKELRELNLTGCRGVTGVGLKTLAGLKGLQKLNLNECRELSDEGLKALADLKGLQTLDLRFTGVTDARLMELVGLMNLQSLDLGNTRVTNAGLKELASLKGLKRLSLRGTEVTTAGLKELASLKQLRALDLGPQGVTDAGLRELAAFAGLEELSLKGCRGLTGAGFEHLAGLKRLHKLDLNGCIDVSNAGLKALADLKGLQEVDLNGCWTVTLDLNGCRLLASLKGLRRLNLNGCHAVGDAELKELASLKELRTLNLPFLGVTPAGLRELRRAMPACRITLITLPVAQ